MLKQAIALAEFANAPHFLALDLRVQAQVFAAQGKYDEAEASFDRAVELFQQAGSRLELNRARYHRAAMRMGYGDTSQKDAARAEALAARDAFADMGAVRDRARTDQLLDANRP